MAQISRGQQRLATIGGTVAIVLGLAALAVQLWRWQRGEANFLSSSVTVVSGLMFCSFGLCALIAGLRAEVGGKGEAGTRSPG